MADATAIDPEPKTEEVVEEEESKVEEVVEEEEKKDGRTDIEKKADDMVNKLK